MKKVVIIGANAFQNPLILKAKEMGYETHVFAWKDGSIGEKTADYFYPISIIEKEKILEECMKIKPDAVVSIASDLAVITVQYIAEKLGMVCNSEESIKVSTNKYEMRKAFKKAGVPTPEFIEVGACEKVEQIRNMSFPIMVKPTDRSGSRAITKIEKFDENEIKVAIEDAINNSFEKKAVVEEYLEGNEYSCECISFAGEHNFLTITKKFTTGAPHFIETGHLEPAGLDEETAQKVKKHIFKALDALEVQYGASHSEFKIDNQGNIRIIEIGARMGGDCIGSDLVQISTGYDFVKMVIQVALGEKPEMKIVTEPKVAAIKFIFSQDDVNHLMMLKEKYPRKIHCVSDIEVNDKTIVDSSSRYGFYILACDSEKEAMRLGNL